MFCFWVCLQSDFVLQQPGIPGSEYPHPQGWVPATGYVPAPPQPQQPQQQQQQQMTSSVNSHVSEGKKDG